MFGPLPTLHTVVFTVVALAACVGAGAWLAYTTPVPLVTSAGALLGLLAGAAGVVWLLHGSDHHHSSQH